MYRLIFCAAAAALSALPVQATAIIDQSNDRTGGQPSSVYLAQSFDDFKLSDAATINHVTFWGEQFIYAPETFTIAFYNIDPATDGLPDLLHPIYSADLTLSMADAYDQRFEADLLDPALLPKNQTIWFSVKAHGDNGTGFFWEQSADPAPHPGFDGWDYSLAYWPGEDFPDHWVAGVNMAFKLDGDIIASPSPEPVGWAMMVCGFGAIGAAMRRHRRAPFPFA